MHQNISKGVMSQYLLQLWENQIGTRNGSLIAFLEASEDFHAKNPLIDVLKGAQIHIQALWKKIRYNLFLRD